MKIYIVGVGGVGGYLGGLLADAGLDVTLVARGENYKAIKENGLVVKSVTGNFVVKPAKVIAGISDIIDPDLIIFSVKTYDIENVAKELNPTVNKNTIILTFQNGVDNDLQIKKFINNSQVYPGVAYVITTKIKPGVIEQTGGLRKFILGDRENPSNKKLKEIEGLMKSVGVNAILSDNITRDIWKKFMFICPFSGMTGLYRKTIGEILSNPETRKQYDDCLREAIIVAKAKGVNVSESIFEEIMETSVSTAPDSKSSLLIDIENGKKNEIETLNGKLVKFAKELNISVPANEHIYNTLIATK